MAVDFVSLAVIALVAAVVPLIARMIPGRIIPETVFLLFIGAVLGPNLLGYIETGETIGFLSELGLAFLFLLAGFEINPKSLMGKQGAHAFGTWLFSFVVAVALVFAMGIYEKDSLEGLAVAIALTSTALGTLMPILAERGLMGTRVGDAIISYGTWGELGPVIAMALLLSARRAWVSALILGLLLLLCVLLTVFSKGFRKYATRLYGFVVEGGDTTSQTYVRLAVLLLVSLVTFSALFDLDIVLGAFAAGFVLRAIVPAEEETLEHKLSVMGHGFFIPLFFVVSGTKVDLAAVSQRPLTLVVFILMLMLVRFLPMLLDLKRSPATADLERGERVSVAFYCTTALPIIVAVTGLAVDAGAMDPEIASVLVCAGAVTVFLMPLLAMIAQKRAKASDYQPLG